MVKSWRLCLQFIVIVEGGRGARIIWDNFVNGYLPQCALGLGIAPSRFKGGRRGQEGIT